MAIQGNTLTVELTSEQIARLRTLSDANGFTHAEVIGALIDTDYEEWRGRVRNGSNSGAPQ
jgi:hypothetical protein